MRAGSESAAFEVVWSDALGCTPDDLRGGRAVVVPHGPALRGTNVVWVLRRGSACVVSVPPPMAVPLSPLAQRHSPDEWFDRQFLLDVLRHPVRGIMGPVQMVCSEGADPSWQTLIPGQQAAPGRPERAQYFAVLLKPTWP